jgi:hypothetical protein
MIFVKFFKDKQMETKIIIALIAGGFSLLVAIISLITSIITGRHSGKIARDIELMKQSFAQQVSTKAITDAALQESLEALKIALQKIQQLKDEIQIILSAIGSSLDAKAAMNAISNARKDLFEVYEEKIANFNEAESKACHQAKNISLAVEEFLLHSLSSKENASDLIDEERIRLTALRNELTEIQQLLRDSRTDRLVQRSTYA